MLCRPAALARVRGAGRVPVVFCNYYI